MQTDMVRLDDERVKVIRLSFEASGEPGFKVGEFFSPSSSPNRSQVTLFLGDSTILSMADALASIASEIRNEQAVVEQDFSDADMMIPQEVN